jgi:broad specificity phosphatase PhoE
VSGAVTVVHLLRHGEVHNPDRVLYGRLPGFRLSETGERMAERAAEHLRGRDVVMVVSSPLERARQTAAPLAALLGVEVKIDERLIESANAFEGRVVSTRPREFVRVRDLRLLRRPLQPSWGEPYDQVAARMLAAVGDARRDAEGHEAVLVSHQLPIWVTRRAAEGRRLWHRPDRRQCGLASLTSLRFTGDRLTGVGYVEPCADLVSGPQVPGA